MRLRSRMVSDAGEDAVASVSSSTMDDQNSTEATLGSPTTRRSWSTSPGSQNPPSSPTPMTSGSTHLNPDDLQAYQSDVQPSCGEQNTYLTNYETAAQAEHNDYPTEISVSQDSQDLYYASQAQSGSLEEPNIYVPPPLQPRYHASYVHDMHSGPQTPTQPQQQPPGPQNSYMTPASQPLNHTYALGYDDRSQHSGPESVYIPHSETPINPQPQYFNYPDLFMAPYSQPPARTAEYQPSTPAPLFTQFSPYQPNQTVQRSLPNDFPTSHYTQLPQLQTSASETLTRFVAPENEQAWSPAVEPNTESRKRRISEADSTMDFAHNKMRTELDEMGAGGQGEPPKRKRKRWTRGKAKGNAKPRGNGGSRGRGNGRGGRGRDGRGRGGSRGGVSV